MVLVTLGHTERCVQALIYPAPKVNTVLKCVNSSNPPTPTTGDAVGVHQPINVLSRGDNGWTHPQRLLPTQPTKWAVRVQWRTIKKTSVL